MDVITNSDFLRHGISIQVFLGMVYTRYVKTYSLLQGKNWHIEAQKSQHFSGDILEIYFEKEIALFQFEFVTVYLNVDKPTLIQVMFWCYQMASNKLNKVQW